MMLQRCMVHGKPGWKYGQTGKCFTGSNARAMAEQQVPKKPEKKKNGRKKK